MSRNLMGLGELGFQTHMIHGLEFVSGLPFMKARVQEREVLLQLTSLGGGLAWSRRFASEYPPESTSREGGEEYCTYGGVAIPGIDPASTSLEAPVAYGPVVQPRDAPPVAGLLGPLADAVAVGFDFGNKSMGISVDKPPHIPDYANVRRLKIDRGFDRYEAITDDIYYVDADYRQPLRMGLSVAHPQSIFASTIVDEIRGGLFAQAIARLAALVAMRTGRPAFSWLAQLGSSEPIRVHSRVARRGDADDDVVGYLGMDVLRHFICVFNYELGEAWLLKAM